MILNTRPKILSKRLNKLAQDQSLKIINAHLSDIEPTIEEKNLIELELKLKNISSYKNIIFTSQAAVIHGLPFINRFITNGEWNIFSIGPATKGMLLNNGVDSISPSNSSSKDVLNLIEQDYPGKNLLFCGDNSNNYLQGKLKENIDEIICYKLVYNKLELDKVSNGPKIILIYNFLTFSFLFKSLDHEILKDKIFIVISERVKDKIQSLSKSLNLRIYVTKEPSDSSMLEVAKNLT